MRKLEARRQIVRSFGVAELEDESKRKR